MRRWAEEQRRVAAGVDCAQSSDKEEEVVMFPTQKSAKSPAEERASSFEVHFTLSKPHLCIKDSSAQHEMHTLKV